MFNDNAFGAIRTYQDRVFAARRIGSDLVNPDLVKLGAAVRQAHSAGGLWLIEVPFAMRGPAVQVPWMP